MGLFRQFQLLVKLCYVLFVAGINIQIGVSYKEYLQPTLVDETYDPYHLDDPQLRQGFFFSFFSSTGNISTALVCKMQAKFL